MTDQPPLDFNPHSDTSHAAALANRPHRRTDRDRVYAALLMAGEGGLTDFELEARTGIKQTSCGKRRLELVRAGCAQRRMRADGTPDTRPAPSGTPAAVWQAHDPWMGGGAS